MPRSVPASLALLLGLASTSLAQGVTPGVGDLAISEVCHTPGCSGSQNTGEWFEVTNISTKVLDLNGLWFQDGPTPGSTQRYFQVLPSVATLPPLNPGERFLFCRSNNPVINGGLANVDYGYAAIGSANAPADNSQVAEQQMNFSSQDPDGMHISVGAPIILGGTLIESVSFQNTIAPFAVPFDTGYTAERINLFAPMQWSAGANSPNCAAASSTTGWGICTPSLDFGTPRLPNFNDASTWGVVFDDVAFPNSGVLYAKAVASVSGGTLPMHAGNGPAGTNLFLGYADTPGLPGFPIGAILPGNPGSIVLNLATANYLGVGSLDGAGALDFTLPIPPNPALVGASIAMQWLTVAPPFTIVQSKGLTATFSP